MIRTNTKTVSQGLNRATAPIGKPRKRAADPDHIARAFHQKISRERERHRRLLGLLAEEGLDISPFTRGDAATVWDMARNKAGEAILELREVGWVRKSTDYSRCFEVTRAGREQLEVGE